MNIVICWRRAVLMALLLIFAFYPIGARQTGQTGQTEKPRQSGEISGRVVTEDGNGVPNVMVNLFPASTGTEGRGQMAGRVSTVITDEEGKFRFADLAPRLYSVNVYQTGGYAVQPSAASDRRERRYYRIGENPTITLMKGGVITGKVTTVEGEPIVGVYVIAVMVRDDEGFKVRQGFGGRSRMTDDRGIYRLYGLAPGSYIVYAGSANYTQSPYSGSIPTYHPSSTRDTAAEVTVTNGSEATGVDIRYRDERGYVVSGTVSGGGETSQPYMLASVTLFNAATGTVVSGTPVRPGESDNGYAIGGVGDGEYEIIARQGGGNEETLSSLPRRVTVKGADVTGIELKLAPMASISGHVVLEKSENACEEKSRYGVEEILLSARRDDKVAGAAPSPQYFSNDVGVGDNGDFAIRYLMAGRYRFESSLPGETWYVKSITNKSAAPARRIAAASKSPGEIDISRAGITIKAGERLTGLTVTVSEGAASLRGKVVAEAEGALIPNRVRIHLVPAETAAADDVLRYGEALVGSDRTFTFKNLAPGRYWLLARIISNDEITDRQTLLLVWDGSERGKLRKEAEAKKSEIELKPCQRVTDYTLKY